MRDTEREGSYERGGTTERRVSGSEGRRVSGSEGRRVAYVSTRISAHFTLHAAWIHVSITGSASEHEGSKELLLRHHIVIVGIQLRKQSINLVVGDLRIVLLQSSFHLVSTDIAAMIRINILKQLHSALFPDLRIDRGLQMRGHVRSRQVSRPPSLVDRFRTASTQIAELGLERCERIKAVLDEQDARRHYCHHERQDHHHYLGRSVVRLPRRFLCERRYGFDQTGKQHDRLEG